MTDKHVFVNKSSEGRYLIRKGNLTDGWTLNEAQQLYWQLRFVLRTKVDPKLTEIQRNCMEAAITNGYFARPDRKVTIKRLADGLGYGKITVVDSLTIAQRKILAAWYKEETGNEVTDL